MLLVNKNKGSSPTRSAELTTNVAVPGIEPVQRFFSESPKKRCSRASLVHQRVFFSGNIGCTNNLKNIRILFEPVSKPYGYFLSCRSLVKVNSSLCNILVCHV